jgi:hypothetical protein
MKQVLRLWSVLVLFTAAVVAGFAAPAQAMEPGGIAGVIVNGDGAPVAGALVVLLHDGHALKATKSGEKGGFAFKNLKAGEYGVAAAKIGVGKGGAKAIVEDGKITEIKIVLMKPPPPPKPGAIVGVVVGPDGNGVQGAFIHFHLIGKLYGKSTFSGEKGGYKSGALPPGKYAVFAGKKGVGMAKAQVEVVSEKITELKLELKP